MEYFLTSAVAEQLGCSDQNIRTLKSRNKDRLQESIHWLKSEDGRTLWTPEGVSVLRSMMPSDTQALQHDMQPLHADTQALHPDTGALQAIADLVALASIEQELKEKIQQSRQRILLNPTEADSLALAQAIDRIGGALGLMRVSQILADSLRFAVQSSVAALEGRQDG